MRKIINDYENYLIDEDGNVYNITTQKMLKGSIGENGYKYYRLSKNNKKQMFYAHRLVAEAFLPNPNNLPVVNHIDGNKLNNNLNNLEWTTYSQNAEHAYQNNLIKPRKQVEYYQSDLADEIWMPIKDTHYSVSSMGRVKNDTTNVLLKPSLTCGYYKVRLSNNGIITDNTIHKLVYCTFNNIEKIPEGYVIDHIDAIKTNNQLSNLRLLTNSENAKKALYEQKTNNSCCKVLQLTIDDKPLQEFPSTREAARQLGLDASTISKVCRGVNKSHGGFHFRYIN